VKCLGYLLQQISGNLGYMFGCDYISYGLILLRLWVCVLIIMARESILRSVYYPGLFISFVVLLMIILFCTFSRINLFPFYLFFESNLIPTVFLILGWDISLNIFRRVFI
jgi:NADH-ubiquinone oxidoreductase chain 4